MLVSGFRHGATKNGLLQGGMLNVFLFPAKPRSGNVGWALRDQQPDRTGKKFETEIRILTSTDADTNVGWALRDQQPEGTVRESETEIRINSR